MHARAVFVLLLLTAIVAPQVSAQQIDYARQAEVAPDEETIGEGYVTPEVQHPRPRSAGQLLVSKCAARQ